MKEKYIAKHVTGVNTCSVPTGLLVPEVCHDHSIIHFHALGHKRNTLVVGVSEYDDEDCCNSVNFS